MHCVESNFGWHEYFNNIKLKNFDTLKEEEVFEREVIFKLS